MNVLIIGPSLIKSKGGITSVSTAIKKDNWLNSEVNIDFLESYVDGNIIKKLVTFIKSVLRLLLNYKKYDVYHIQSASGASFYRKSIIIKLLQRLKRNNIIVHIHGGGFKEFYESSNSHQKTYIKNVLSSSKLVLVLSRNWLDFFTDSLNLDNVEILTNGVNITEYSRAISRPTETSNSFLFLGRLEEKKGIYDLIEAIFQSENKNVILYIAGLGELNKVQALIIKYGLESQCKLLGWIDQTEKIDYLSRVSTLVLPSYAEGLPVSILEAMAAKKSIIASNVGGIPTVINSDSGILITPGDIDGLTKAINELDNNPKKIKAYGEKAYSIIEKSYDISKIHKKLYSFYQLIK